MRIIVLEESAGPGGALHEHLQPEGFDVLGVRSALEFFRNMAVGDYDIAIVDVGLPDADRLEIVSSLRAKRGIGIITLAARNEARDRIACFESGADLHFPRPVDADELLHGIRSLGRRIGEGRAWHEAPAARVSRWFFDPTHWSLQAPNGELAKLTAVEAQLIQRLLIQSQTVVSRTDLRAALGYGDDKAGDKSLDAVIRRLRRKVETATGFPAPVKTVHGRGYLFSAPARSPGDVVLVP